uniref:Endonuclease-reverse transcriptase n=1 Tax=Cacopsylla melanoneura TaxID=428564 RepID=A0A8D8UV89_9HEMI
MWKSLRELKSEESSIMLLGISYGIRKSPRNVRKYSTFYIPILTYGSETWTMRKKDINRMQAAEMKFLRSIAGKTRRDRVRNTDIRRTLKIECLEETMRNRRLRWFGHMKRMSSERLPRKMYEMEMEGVRPRGRPRYRYRDTIKSDVERKGENLSSIENEETFNNRVWWRGCVHRPVPEAGTLMVMYVMYKCTY